MPQYRPEDLVLPVPVGASCNGALIPRRATKYVQDDAQQLQTLALYNGSRTLLMSVQKAQDENTIEVVDGLNAAIKAMGPELPPGVRLQAIADNSRAIRVGGTTCARR